MTQPCSSELVLKNTAEAVTVPLKDGISSLSEVYNTMITADVDPVTGQCFNSDYIRQHIVQAHQHLEQTASSGLKSLDENLERLTEDKGKLEQEKSSTETHLENLRTEQASNEKLHRDSEGALEQARRNLNSTKETLQGQKLRKHNAKIVTGVRAGLMVIPFVGWVTGTGMMIGGGVGINQLKHAVRVAEEEVRRADDEITRYKKNVSEYKSKISQTTCDINQKDDKLKQMREGIQKVKQKREAIVVFQEKMRSVVHPLGVLSARARVAEHQTHKSILQEPVMKVIEDVMKATEEITRLIDQMKMNSQGLATICASEQF